MYNAKLSTFTNVPTFRNIRIKFISVNMFIELDVVIGMSFSSLLTRSSAHSFVRIRQSKNQCHILIVWLSSFSLEFNNALNMWLYGQQQVNRQTFPSSAHECQDIERKKTSRINVLSLIQSILEIPSSMLNLNIITDEMSFRKICRSLDFMDASDILCAFYSHFVHAMLSIFLWLNLTWLSFSRSERVLFSHSK